MKIGKGVEWAAHACALLALLPPDKALSKEALAEFLGVPPQYLAKQLQALSKVGIVATQRGASGGYWLAVAPDTLSLWDVTAAIEGTTPSFRCTEVRRNGPCGASAKECHGPCHIAAAFFNAEAKYREALASVPLITLITKGANDATLERKQNTIEWIKQKSTNRGLKNNL